MPLLRSWRYLLAMVYKHHAPAELRVDKLIFSIRQQNLGPPHSRGSAIQTTAVSYSSLSLALD
jgi:hypothetical protein